MNKTLKIQVYHNNCPKAANKVIFLNNLWGMAFIAQQGFVKLNKKPFTCVGLASFSLFADIHTHHFLYSLIDFFWPRSPLLGFHLHTLILATTPPKQMWYGPVTPPPPPSFLHHGLWPGCHWWFGGRVPAGCLSHITTHRGPVTLQIMKHGSQTTPPHSRLVASGETFHNETQNEIRQSHVSGAHIYSRYTHTHTPMETLPHIWPSVHNLKLL